MVSAAPTRQSVRDGADQRALPAQIEKRYQRDGDRLLFPDGVIAIEDRGLRLVARTENVQVARDLVEIARARGWDRISSRGTDAFRAEVARAAARLRIEVTNDSRRTSDRSAVSQELVQPPMGSTERPSRGKRNARRVGDMLIGEFVEAGKAPYRFVEGNAASFYVRIATAQGQRDLWGTQLREALSDSWTFPQPGDRIGVQYLGAQMLATGGRPDDPEPRRRNLWRIEKASFFEERKRDAASIRSGGPDVSAPESLSPNAREVAAILRAANLFAASRIASGPDQARFVDAVRGTLASTVQTGGRLPEIKLRDRQRATDSTRTPDASRSVPTRSR
jgi:hypothetical protein